MATSSVPSETTPGNRDSVDLFDPLGVVRQVLDVCASLKLTVVLFALSIFLIFAGTLAQVDKDIWQVIDEYFRCAVAKIHLQIFFPPSFFPSKPQVPGWFPFPGGWTIGTLLTINLVAAHLVRFKVQARSESRYIAGWGALAVGILLTALVIYSGTNKDGLLEGSIFSWSTLWKLFQLALGATFLGLFYGVVRPGAGRMVERAMLAVVAAIVGSALVWLLYLGPQAQFDDSSMRILWQLVKGTFAGIVLLGACWLLFDKRAGIVLLHGGVGLMMFNELFVGLTNIEGQMQIEEGETVSFVQDIRTVELAVIDRSNPKEDTVTVVPLSRLKAAAENGKRIHDERLPFDLEVVKFIQNSNLREATPDDANPADGGAGLKMFADEVRPGSGTDNDSKVDISAAYVRFFKKGTETPLGTRLVSLALAVENRPERVAVPGEAEKPEDFDVYLRFERHYKPYAMTLIDVRKDDYVGTNTPRNYSSDVHLVDASRNVDRSLKIWMNNPLRFAGETFYQSSYNKYAKTVIDESTGRPTRKLVEATTLSVVKNTGWMIPYVGCMIVVVGMLAQFGFTLMRFLRRTVSSSAHEADDSESPARDSLLAKHRPAARPAGRSGASEAAADLFPQKPAFGLATILVPLAVVLLFAGYIGSKARVPKAKDGAFNLYAFGELPLIEQGRPKPFDTLARNSLRIISGRQDFTGEDGKKHPAIEWLLDLIAKPDEAEKHKVFRIENHEVLEVLGLEPRSGYRYSVEEFRPKIEEFNEQVKRAKSVKPADRDAVQRKLMELDGRIRTYTLLQASFRPPPLPEVPTREDFEKDPRAAQQQLALLREAVMELPARLEEMNPPMAVPMKLGRDEKKAPPKDDKDWEPYSIAWTKGFLQTRMLGEDPPPGTVALNSIFVSYAKGDEAAFNKAVSDYASQIETGGLKELKLGKLHKESFFNHFEPFYYAAVLQVFAFLLTVVAWLVRPVWPKLTGIINWSAFALIAFTLLVHSWGLLARMEISGRPPVTNLYSSAVFIGWGAVLLGLILEMVYRLGFGNIIASVAGFGTLLIAHMLAGDGDTFTVLQAVLDTQFWLATHVTCITFGYAATFVAGLLGMAYVFFGVATPFLRNNVGRDLAKMIYGILCFAIFFSFFGTVLGGLWADDSWGRFWGWDPKENGALIIVLWNALVLHARWGNMVKDRGMAVLAIGGNIMTSWSWFGVNELGVGLHSYGFTEGVLLALAGAIGVFIVWMMAGCLPKELWSSFRKADG